MNYPLAFSTITTVLDWATSNPQAPQEPLLEELEQLRQTVEHKIAMVVERIDKTRNVGQSDT